MKHPLFKQKAKAQTSNNMKCNFLQCERFREISKASNEDCEKICAAFFSRGRWIMCQRQQDCCTWRKHHQQTWARQQLRKMRLQLLLKEHHYSLSWQLVEILIGSYENGNRRNTRACSEMQHNTNTIFHFRRCISMCIFTHGRGIAAKIKTN